MENKKLEQLQKMYEDGLITEDELKTKRKKIISEIIDSSNSENSVKDENTTEKPKKKHKFIKILLICILVFFGFCFICSLFDDENASQAQDSKVEKTEEGKNIDKSSKEKGIEDKTKEKSTNKIGKWYALSDDFEIKITSLNQENYYQYADYVIKPEDENTYISVYFSYRNVSSVPVLHLTVASNEFNKFYLQSPEGRKYDLDVWGSAALFYETLSFTEKLDWALNDGSFNKGFLKPYSENLESGKNGFAIEVPKNKVQEKGWKLIVNDLEFSVSL